jgi:MEMO1 family protein
MLSQYETEHERDVKALISPHAGYRYSGLTAAAGFAHLKGRTFKHVVIVSPSHREYFDGVSVYPGAAYVTPLGKVPVSRRLREKLLEQRGCIVPSLAGHGEEHAIEVQIPFLQCVLDEFDLLPVVLGDQRREYCFELGESLARLLENEDALLVASTDLSHYHQSATAHSLDTIMIENIRAGDADMLMTNLEAGNTEACGGGPTVAVLAALQRLGTHRIEILGYRTSGDVTGDHDAVVGYLSAIAYPQA